MNKKLIIFGYGEIAQLAHFYFKTDSDYEVVAFTLDREFIEEKEFCGLPVVPFDEITRRFPPGDHSMFVALGYSKVNALRKEKYLSAKQVGYKLASYISSKSTLLNEGNFGDNCFIFEDNTIQPFVKVGNNVTLWSGNHIGHHTTIKDHCFITSHVVVSGGVQIGESCFLGVNATLRNHIKIGEKCVIGAGTLILGDTPSEGLYIGTPTPRSELKSTELRKI